MYLTQVAPPCSESTLDAREAAASLREHVDRQLQKEPDLASRLAQLSLPENDNPLLEERPSLEMFSAASIAALLHNDENTNRGDSSSMRRTTTGTRPSLETTRAFDKVLSSTRVYARVDQSRDLDGVSTILTTRSHAWSILSGISMAQISVMAVISLPLSNSELRRFRSLSSILPSINTELLTAVAISPVKSEPVAVMAYTSSVVTFEDMTESYFDLDTSNFAAKRLYHSDLPIFKKRDHAPGISAGLRGSNLVSPAYPHRRHPAGHLPTIPYLYIKRN